MAYANERCNRDKRLCVMSFRTIYQCDLCRTDTIKANVMGLYFVNLWEFRISEPEATQGTHVCTRCLDQLRKQLGPIQVPTTLPQEPK